MALKQNLLHYKNRSIQKVDHLLFMFLYRSFDPWGFVKENGGHFHYWSTTLESPHGSDMETHSSQLVIST